MYTSVDFSIGLLQEFLFPSFATSYFKIALLRLISPRSRNDGDFHIMKLSIKLLFSYRQVLSRIRSNVHTILKIAWPRCPIRRAYRHFSLHHVLLCHSVHHSSYFLESLVFSVPPPCFMCILSIHPQLRANRETWRSLTSPRPRHFWPGGAPSNVMDVCACTVSASPTAASWTSRNSWTEKTWHSAWPACNPTLTTTSA